MRATFPAADARLIAAHIEASYGIGRVRELKESFAAADSDTVTAILEEAVKYAAAHLTPLNDAADAQGCRVEHGRVCTPPGHRDAWNAFIAGGWTTLDAPEEFGGQALPSAVAAAAQEIFDRACPSFGMLPVPQRSATRLIAAHGDADMQAEWLPRIISGEWGATICISEVEAGSDAGRIRTAATPNGDGTWSITGEKCWISYGDHDLTPRIGHCLLARTPGQKPGGAGLSLFLVPDMLDDGSRNNVLVRRIEHKLGLHGSPTCALGFEGATGRMIGAEGRGLAQMFVMITNMRLSVSAMGLGIASGSADLSLDYAKERRQGGSGAQAAPIISHADVQRQLLEQAARVETLRGLILTLANQADLSLYEADEAARDDAGALVQWLLPIVKTAGGDVGFDVASMAVQVLGGAGYTKEWPAEQGLRDARVLTIFEGTTGIQALDLLHRRVLRGDRRGYSLFLNAAREALSHCAGKDAEQFAQCLDQFEQAAEELIAIQQDRSGCDAGATAFLQLAILAATGWIGARLAILEGSDPTHRRMAAAGRYWLSDIGDRAALLRAQALAGGDRLDLLTDIAG